MTHGICGGQLYYCMMAPAMCEELQIARVPKGQMTSVAELDSSTNPKTLWWAWCPDLEVSKVEDLLAELTKATPHGDAIDFHTKLKLGSPGEQVKEELEVAKRMWADSKH